MLQGGSAATEPKFDFRANFERSQTNQRGGATRPARAFQGAVHNGFMKLSARLNLGSSLEDVAASLQFGYSPFAASNSKRAEHVSKLTEVRRTEVINSET
jgi:hypothetical protein